MKAVLESLLIISPISDNLWRVVRPLRWRVGEDVFEVPVDYVTDLASVPRPFWPIIAPHGTHAPAAVLHDWLLDTGVVRRSQADRIFREALRASNVPRWRRWVMWAAVRSWSWYRRQTR